MTDVRHEVEDLLKQQRAVEGVIEDLRTFLDQPRPRAGARGSHGWATKMAGKLMNLHDRLVRHFRAEEISDTLRELSIKRPHVLRAFESLRHDHDRILADFRSILGAVMIYSEGKNPENPHLRRWTISALERLAQHEHDETELFQRVLYQETGSGD